MGRFNDEHLAKMMTLGVPWDEMTPEQKFEQRKEWDKVVSDPNELYCTCPRSSCRNNHNCTQCVTLHRYYDGFPDCLRPIDDKMQEGVPADRRYNMHLKFQSSGGNDKTGLIDPADPVGSRERLMKAREEAGQDVYSLMDEWDKVAKNKKNQACRCKNSDCWYHGNCVKCIALHRHFGGFPACDRYIADHIEKIVDAYWAEQGGKKGGVGE